MQAVSAGAPGRAVALSLKGITHCFHRSARAQTPMVLSEIDVDVYESEFVTIMGPSGCGKSSLLNIAAGFLRPTGGVVECGGMRVPAPGPDRGVVSQHPALFPWMTVLENVLFGPGARGRRSRRAEVDAARQLLAEVGLAHCERKRPYELSGGMQHRAAIVRTIANRPRILLMDEPFASLDAQTRLEMQDWLLGLWQAHRFTVLFVTHDIEEGLLLSDRVFVLSRSPARIQREIDVTFPRPRSQETTLDPEFVDMRGHVRGLMRGTRDGT